MIIIIIIHVCRVCRIFIHNLKFKTLCPIKKKAHVLLVITPGRVT